MSANDDPTASMLDGLTPPIPKGGTVEAAVQTEVDRLRSLGFIEDHHAGSVELALTVARDIDNSFGRGAPSGRANLYRVMNEVLETLPQPEAASKDSLDQVVQALLHGNPEDDHVPLPSAPILD